MHLPRFAVPVVLLLCTGGLKLLAAAPVAYLSGSVFADHNADGRRDAAEPGLAGVLVSNGTDVVATDAGGRYTLPVAPRSEVFVIKPPGYELPRGAHNVPMFYRLHWPEGPGEELRYGGVPPTGALPAEHDFPLRPGTARDAFSVLVVADPQVHNPTHIEYYERRFIDELSTRDDFAFGVMLGDIVRNDLSLFDPYLPVNARLPGPIFHVVGNHDIDYDATSLTTAVATFTRIFGPANYALMEGEAVFIVLNNVFTPLPGAAKADGDYTGGLTPAAATFVTNLLRHLPEDRLIVLCQHIPFIPGNARPGAHRPADQVRLLDLLHGRRVLALAGHTHTQWHSFLGEESGWRGPEPLRQWVVGTASGSWWGGEPDAHGLPTSTMKDGTPPGYGILHVDGTDFRLEYRVPGQPAEHQLHVTAPRHVVARERDQPFQVNVYNGSARTSVAYRILPVAPERWIPVAHAPGIDAAYVGRAWQRSTSATPPAGTYLPPPVESQHLWQGNLPRILPVGAYTMEVRVRDEWGVETLAQHAFEVHPATLPYGRN
jgi:hypothetical protein